MSLTLFCSQGKPNHGTLLQKAILSFMKRDEQKKIWGHRMQNDNYLTQDEQSNYRIIFYFR